MAQSENTKTSSAPVLTAGHIQLKVCRYGPMFYNIHDTYIGRSLDLYGEYSENECRLFRQIIHPGQTVLDIGANVGAFTIPLGHGVGPAGRVMAFEPQRMVFQMLCGNVMISNLINIETIHAAVGGKVGSISVPVPDYGQKGNFGSITVGGAYEKSETVSMVTIDSLNLSACHFMKVDVEGFEKEVIVGAIKTIKKYRPTLYVENDRKEKSPDLIGALMKLDYRLYWHLPTLFNSDNFLGNSENIFGNTMSANLVCVPAETQQSMSGFTEIKTPNDWFM